MSLVEVMLSMSLLVVGVMGIVSSIVSTLTLAEVDRETGLAVQAARSVLERLQDHPFEDVFADFNSDASDDVHTDAGLGPGTPWALNGPDFTVEGLVPRPDDADGAVGRILVPEWPAVPTMLREDLADARFGLPRDLDASGGVPDGDDHAADYVLLPVVVVVEWVGVSGERRVEFETFLVER